MELIDDGLWTYIVKQYIPHWAQNKYLLQFVYGYKYGPVYYIYPNPLLGQDMTQGQFLSGV